MGRFTIASGIRSHHLFSLLIRTAVAGVAEVGPAWINWGCRSPATSFEKRHPVRECADIAPRNALFKSLALFTIGVAG